MRAPIFSRFTAASTLALASCASVAVNFSSLGQSYEGIGALSGGGGVTRLLIDYEESLQQDIMDLLFKPNSGASLEIIKVEIGGDTQSTEGTEMSHEHYRGDLNCSRGYEWYVLQEAKRRNPDIRTYGLSWGVPGWIGDGSYYSQDNLKYHVDWVYCSNAVWGVEIDYMGVWNERGADPTWTKNLRVALDDAGFQHTRIVSADTAWNDAIGPMAADPAYAASVDIIGAHYPGVPPAQAFSFNKSLWASEMWDLSQVDDWAGALQLAVDLTNHAQWGLSASVLWCLIYSWYAPLPFSRVTNTNAGAGHSVLTAAEPWSGHYELNPTIYAMAHHTQFAEPGWTYLSSSSGGMGDLPGGGKLLTLINTYTPASVLEFSMIAHTVGVSTPQSVTFSLAGLSTQALPSLLHVWVTTESSYFVQQADVPVATDSTFTVTFPPDAFVSVTTTTGQGAGSPAQVNPPSAPFPFPYADAFEGYPDQGYAKYFCDEGGIFQVMPIPAGYERRVEGAAPGGHAFYQVITQVPIVWETNPVPYTLIGNFNGGANQSAWRDYTLSVDVAFDDSAGPTPGMAYVASMQACAAGDPTQSFTMSADASLANGTALESLAYPGLCLGVTGATLYPGANDIGLVKCGTLRGVTMSAVSAGSWQTSPALSQLVDANDGQCLDILSGSTSLGARAITYSCKTGSDPTLSNQKWNASVDSATQRVSLHSELEGMCLAVCPQADPSVHLKIGARINAYTRNGAPINGYTLYLYPSPNTTALGTWQLSYASTQLTNGTTAMPIVSGTFYTLSITMVGSSISASLNGVQLGPTVTGDNHSGYGMAAIGSGWHHAWFDNFAVHA